MACVVDADDDDDRVCAGLDDVMGIIEAGVNRPSLVAVFFEEEEEEEAAPAPIEVDDDARKLFLLRIEFELVILLLAFFKNFCRACRRTNSSTPKTRV